MSLKYLFLDWVNIQITFHFALSDADFELSPDCSFIFSFSQRTVHPGRILFKHIANHSDLTKSFLAATIALDEGVVIVDCVGL